MAGWDQRTYQVLTVVLAIVFLGTGLTNAQDASSPNFILESSVQATAGGDTSSDNFSATSTIGESSPIGEASSTSFTADTGFTSSETPVNIDIKPGGLPNSINTKSRGKIPVAILSDVTFDAPTDVDALSLTFGRTGDNASPVFCAPYGEDVNDDGFIDQVCQFNTQEAGFQVGDTEGILRGQTVDGGTLIIGIDSVRIVR